MPTATTVMIGLAGGSQIDRGDMLVPGTLQVSMFSNQRWTCRFTLRSYHGDYLPTVGALMDVYEAGTRIFSGSVDEKTGTRLIHGYGSVIVEESYLCIDFAARLDQRLADVPMVWPAGTPRGQIVFEMMQQYCSAEFIQYVRVPTAGGFIYDGGNTTEIFVANHESVSNLIQSLADADGFIWFVDPDRRLHYQAASLTTAPFSFSNTSNNFTNLTVTENRGDYWNEEHRRISYEWQGPTGTTLVGDSVVRSWTLPGEVGKLQGVSLNGVEVGSGSPGQGSPFTWEYGSDQITHDVALPVITAGDVLIAYWWPLGSDFIVMTAITGETPAIRSAYEGNSGLYQIKVDDTEETSGTLAEIKAEKDLNLWAHILVSAEVVCHGFTGPAGVSDIYPRPGMVVTLSLLYPHIEQDCFISEVQVDHVPGQGFQYTLKAYNISRVPNAVDFFRQISGTGGSGGGGGGVTTVGPEGPPGPAYTETLSPPVSNATAVVIIEGWANDQMFGFEGDIDVPTSHINYAHMERIEVTATLSNGESYPIAVIYRTGAGSSWASGNVHYRAIVDRQPATADQNWYVLFTPFNENNTPTPDPFTVGPLNVQMSEIMLITGEELTNARYLDENDGQHTVVIFTLTAVTLPVMITLWIDFNDGRAPVWQGWRRLHSVGQIIRIGDPIQGTQGQMYAGTIWRPVDPSKETWTVYGAAGAIDSAQVIPASAVWDTFTVQAVGPALETDITNIRFMPSPAGGPVIYSTNALGEKVWIYYELRWDQPSFNDADHFWYSRVTLQKGRVNAGVWEPAPDAEGETSHPGLFYGRVHADGVAAQTGDPDVGAEAIIKGDILAAFKFPTSPYNTFRFWVYSGSRRGVLSDGMDGVTALNVGWPGGADHYDLVIGDHPDTLDARYLLPASVGPGLKKDVTTRVVEAALGDGMKFDFANATTIDVGVGTKIELGKLKMDFGDGLTAAGNAVKINLGLGLTVSAGAVQADLGAGTQFNGSKIELKIAGGLEFVGTTAQVKTGDGVEVVGGSVRAKVGDGLEIFATATRVKAGGGLTVSGGTVIVNLGQGITLSGSAIAVKSGDGLVFDGGGNIDVNTGAGLNIVSFQVAIPTNGVTTSMILGLQADKITAGTISATVSMTAPSLSITAGSTLVNIDSGNLVKVSDTSGSTVRCLIASQYFEVAQGATLNFSRLQIGNLSMSDVGGVNSCTLTTLGLFFGGNQVVKGRQADPGAPGGWADVGAQIWAANLRTALRNHGLI